MGVQHRRPDLGDDATPTWASKPSSQNFLIWWDADETRELEDGTSIEQVRRQLDPERQRLRLEQRHQVHAGADRAICSVTGARRSIWRESNSSALRLYTTTNVTTRRIYTLMHDAQYRVQVSAEQTAYNQPPHPSFHIGSGMAAPPNPNIQIR